MNGNSDDNRNGNQGRPDGPPPSGDFGGWDNNRDSSNNQNGQNGWKGGQGEGRMKPPSGGRGPGRRFGNNDNSNRSGNSNLNGNSGNSGNSKKNGK